MEIKAVEKIGNYKFHYDNEHGLAFSPIDYKKLEVTAKEMFEKLGYEYSYDDGFIEYLNSEPIPNRINTDYIRFKKITFNKMDENICIQRYKTDRLCLEVIIDSKGSIVHLGKEELKAINKQIEELGWDNE